MRVAHRLRQGASRSRRVLKHREVVGRRRRRIVVPLAAQARREVLADGDHPHVGEQRLPALGIARDQQQARPTVVEAEGKALGAEEGEEGHGDGAALERAEKRAVEGQRRLQHDGHAVAGSDALRGEEVREARRPGAERREVDLVMTTVGRGQAKRGGVPGVAVDALMRDVEVAAVSVEEFPQGAPAELLERLGVVAKGDEALHVCARSPARGCATSRSPAARPRRPAWSPA
jgi:hypothetical protein